jgi:hypothetical protein
MRHQQASHFYAVSLRLFQPKPEPGSQTETIARRCCAPSSRPLFQTARGGIIQDSAWSCAARTSDANRA